MPPKNQTPSKSRPNSPSKKTPGSDKKKTPISPTTSEEEKALDTDSSSSEDDIEVEEYIAPENKNKCLKVQLAWQQINNFEKLVEIWEYFFINIDTSLAGSGKSFVSSALCQYYGFKNFVVFCPNNVKGVWQIMHKLYKLPVPRIGANSLVSGPAIVNYESLIGRGDGDLKCGLLTKTTNTTKGKFNIKTEENGKDKNQVIYEGTEDLDELIEEGTMFVFDEIHKTKNSDTATHAAVKAIVNRIGYLVNKHGYKSRVSFSTGTLADDPDQIIGLLETIGIMKNTLYSNVRGDFKYKGYGYEDIYNYAYRLAPEATEDAVESIVGKGDINSKNVKNVAIEIYSKVIQKFIVSAMPSVIDFPLDCKNSYYYMPVKRIDALNRAVEELANAVKYDEKSGTTGIIASDKKGNAGFGKTTICLKKIERLKLEIPIRQAIEILESNKNAKVCIVLNYVTDIKVCARILAKYSPMMFYGDIPLEQRNANIKKFQRPNRKRRLLIGNLTVISTGISLHDIDGRFPRYAFISPNYRAMDTQQVIFRFHRTNCKSQAVIKFFYALNSTKEKSIQDAYTRKAESFKKFMEFQAKSDILFPGDYPEEFEDEDKDMKNFMFGKDSVTFTDSHRGIAIGDLVDNVGNKIDEDYAEDDYEPAIDSDEEPSDRKSSSKKKKDSDSDSDSDVPPKRKTPSKDKKSDKKSGKDKKGKADTSSDESSSEDDKKKKTTGKVLKKDKKASSKKPDTSSSDTSSSDISSEEEKKKKTTGKVLKKDKKATSKKPDTSSSDTSSDEEKKPVEKNKKKTTGKVLKKDKKAASKKPDTSSSDTSSEEEKKPVEKNKKKTTGKSSSNNGKATSKKPDTSSSDTSSEEEKKPVDKNKKKTAGKSSSNNGKASKKPDTSSSDTSSDEEDKKKTAGKSLPKDKKTASKKPDTSSSDTSSDEDKKKTTGKSLPKAKKTASKKPDTSSSDTSSDEEDKKKITGKSLPKDKKASSKKPDTSSSDTSSDEEDKKESTGKSLPKDKKVASKKPNTSSSDTSSDEEDKKKTTGKPPSDKNDTSSSDTSSEEEKNPVGKTNKGEKDKNSKSVNKPHDNSSTSPIKKPSVNPSVKKVTKSSSPSSASSMSSSSDSSSDSETEKNPTSNKKKGKNVTIKSPTLSDYNSASRTSIISSSDSDSNSDSDSEEKKKREKEDLESIKKNIAKLTISSSGKVNDFFNSQPDDVRSPSKIKSPNSPSKIRDLNKSARLDNKESIELKNSFNFDIESKEYFKFKKFFKGLELLLRFAIYMKNPITLHKATKEDLELLTKNFNFKSLAMDILDEFSNGMSFEEKTVVIEENENSQNKFFNHIYKKYVDKNAGDEKLWF